MLRPGWTDLGVGQSLNHFWTQKFGAMTGKSLSPPTVPPDPDPPGQSGNGLPPPEAPPEGFQPPPPGEGE